MKRLLVPAMNHTLSRNLHPSSVKGFCAEVTNFPQSRDLCLSNEKTFGASYEPSTEKRFAPKCVQLRQRLLVPTMNRPLSRNLRPSNGNSFSASYKPSTE